MTVGVVLYNFVFVVLGGQYCRSGRKGKGLRLLMVTWYGRV